MKSQQAIAGEMPQERAEIRRFLIDFVQVPPHQADDMLEDLPAIAGQLARTVRQKLQEDETISDLLRAEIATYLF